MGLMDPRPAQPPSLTQQIADLRREVEQMRQQPRAEQNPVQYVREIVFSYPGVPEASKESGAYLVKDFAALIYRLDWTARVAPSAAVNFEIKVNGTVVETVTLGAGETAETIDDLAIEVEEWDRISMTTTGSVDAALDSPVFMLQMQVLDEETHL